MPALKVGVTEIRVNLWVRNALENPAPKDGFTPNFSRHEANNTMLIYYVVKAPHWYAVQGSDTTMLPMAASLLVQLKTT